MVFKHFTKFITWIPQVQSGAWARAADSESSNTGSPSATQGGPGTAPGASPTPSIKAPNQEVTHADFHRCADIYLGGKR